ncbi:MAG: DUF4296 domain-containing protein [Bacteroidetes bacterium]|nr:DUF4296 domain-containing protein [Bacteroidota bacterium]
MRRLPFFLLALASCTQTDRPKDVLSQTQLSAFLVEVYLAEARTEAVPVPRDSSIRYFLPYEKKLLQKHNISDSVIKKTYAYYLDHPKELELVYDAVIDTLSLRQQREDKAPNNGLVPVERNLPFKKKLPALVKPAPK